MKSTVYCKKEPSCDLSCYCYSKPPIKQQKNLLQSLTNAFSTTWTQTVLSKVSKSIEPTNLKEEAKLQANFWSHFSLGCVNFEGSFTSPPQGMKEEQGCIGGWHVWKHTERSNKLQVAGFRGCLHGGRKILALGRS